MLLKINKRLNQARNTANDDEERPFGDFSLLFCGDFYQLGPIQDAALYYAKNKMNLQFKNSTD